MSRYGYDYSLTPSRPTGWRSALASVLTIGTVVAVSAISGAIVTLQLFGPETSAPDRPATAAATAPPYVVAERLALPPQPHPASGQAHAAQVFERSQTVVAAAQPTPTPIAAAAPQAAAPAAPVAAADEQAAPHVSESELTFTKGYARRRAVQEAAASGAKVDLARLESQSQVGREAIKAKPRVARTNAPQDQRRVADAREAGGQFDRFDRSERFDFGRHQAMAFGDTREPRANRRAPQQGGFFGGLF
jgi:type IV secretory pathway VirB10-like protein